MKIIQLIQKPQLRGAEIFACQLSNHLIDQKNEVMVISIFVGDAELPFKGPVVHLDRPIGKRLYDITGWRMFSKIVESFQADLIQANAADTLKFAVSSKILSNWKAPIIFRNANKMGDFINSKFKWHLNNFYLSRVELVISVSEECRKDFTSTFNFPEKKTQTIQIGVEEKKVGETPGDLEKIFAQGPVVTHIGGFVPEKNHFGVLRIFQDLLKKRPNAQLLLIGKGKLESEIKKKVQDLNLDQSIHFIGYRKDVLEILNSSSAFILPSLIEGLPAVILEAMYCRTPVIAYRVGGIGEVVKSGVTGWAVDKNDEKEFVAHLIQVIKKDDSVQRVIDNSQEMVNQNFMNDSIAKKFLIAYSRLTEGKIPSKNKQSINSENF